ncbi:MAG: class I SAM-dependent methyltransferase [Candidatus Coatesbacteria bacterium]|nr:class I SAM-dependent methyltransferase [Candidatus Coatesbacteria bacterium]
MMNPATEFLDLQHYQDPAYQEGHGDKQSIFRRRAEALWSESQGGRLLDAGCSTGKFLEAARERGFEVEGIEPSKYGAEVACKKGLKVLCGLLSDLNAGAYDIVTSNHVLEHIVQPVEFMKEIRRVLKSDGFACIEVPGEFDNLPYMLNSLMDTIKTRSTFSPHINYFDIMSLRNLFQKSGLHLYKWYTYTLPIHPEKFSARLRILPNNLVRCIADVIKKGRNIVCYLKRS